MVYDSVILRKRYMTTFSSGDSLKNEICSLSLSLSLSYNYSCQVTTCTAQLKWNEELALWPANCNDYMNVPKRSLLMSFYWIKEWLVSPSSRLAKRVNIKGSHVNLLVITLRNTRMSNHILPHIPPIDMVGSSA